MEKMFKKGFTLVELMIVVAIIAILSFVAMPQMGKQIRKAKDSKAVAMLGAARSVYHSRVASKLVDGALDDIDLTTLRDELDNKTKANITGKAVNEDVPGTVTKTDDSDGQLQFAVIDESLEYEEITSTSSSSVDAFDTTEKSWKSY